MYKNPVVIIFKRRHLIIYICTNTANYFSLYSVSEYKSKRGEMVVPIRSHFFIFGLCPSRIKSKE